MVNRFELVASSTYGISAHVAGTRVFIRRARSTTSFIVSTILIGCRQFRRSYSPNKRAKTVISRLDSD